MSTITCTSAGWAAMCSTRSSNRRGLIRLPLSERYAPINTCAIQRRPYRDPRDPRENYPDLAEYGTCLACFRPATAVSLHPAECAARSNSLRFLPSAVPTECFLSNSKQWIQSCHLKRPKTHVKSRSYLNNVQVGLRSLRNGSPRQNIFNFCESFISFRPPHHNMTEISDGEQTPIFAAFDRTSMKGPNFIVRGQPVYNLPVRGYKGPLKADAAALHHPQKEVLFLERIAGPDQCFEIGPAKVAVAGLADSV